jgi:predicted secreted protein
MRISLFILCTLLSSSIWADIQLAPLLNKISLQLQAEQWVTTKTALVTVGINAAVADKGIDKIQAEVMQKLNQLSNKSPWHVLSFNRQLDSSGLENIQISAESRLPQTELAGLRNKAKAISKPGENFTIDNIQFTPSDEELKRANIDLRHNLYQQVKEELDAINKMYPEQKYYIHQINFNSGTPIEPMPLANNNLMMAKTAVERTTPLSIGNKMQIQATVIIASLPDLNIIGQKLLH